MKPIRLVNASILLCVVCALFSSCKKDDPSFLNTDVSSITLTSGVAASMNVVINSSDPWELQDLPEWLTASATTGNTSTTIKLTATSENASSEERVATIRVVSGNLSCEVVVKQLPAFSTCAANPKDITTLYNSIAFRITCSGNVLNYRYNLYLASTISKYTNADIIKDLMDTELYSPDDDYIYWHQKLTANTDYVLCTVSFDKDGNQGDLIKTPVKTPASVGLDALAYIGNVDTSSETVMYWNTEKSASCGTYHMMVSADAPIDAVAYLGTDGEVYYNPPILYAYVINYYLNNDKKSFSAWNYNIEKNLVNSGSFQHTHSKTAECYLIATWGMFSDGKLSPTVLCDADLLDSYLMQDSRGKVARKKIHKDGNLTRGVSSMKYFKNVMVK